VNPEPSAAANGNAQQAVVQRGEVLDQCFGANRRVARRAVFVGRLKVHNAESCAA